jgi:hypothetical protein
MTHRRFGGVTSTGCSVASKVSSGTGRGGGLGVASFQSLQSDGWASLSPQRTIKMLRK